MDLQNKANKQSPLSDGDIIDLYWQRDEKAFIDALKLLHGKLTIIMIAHRLTTVAHCDMNIHLSAPETENA